MGVTLRLFARFATHGLWRVCLLCSLIFPRVGWAHAVSNSALQLDLDGSTLTGSWRVVLRDLDPILDLDADADGVVDADEVQGASTAIGEYLGSRLEIEVGGVVCHTRIRGLRLEAADLVATVEAACASIRADEALQLRYDLFFEHDTSHQGLLRVSRGASTHTAVFSHDARIQTIAAGEPIVWEVMSRYLAQGAWHIWHGYDHLLFSFSLLLPAVLVRHGTFWQARGRWEPASSAWLAWRHVLRLVTAFTLAHSLTLGLAALGWVRPPERLIEVIIAASVAVAALDNLFPIVVRRAWALGFAFGLVHGFGFANALGELGLPKGAELLALASFNLGVEGGQLVVVALVLPAALALRRSPGYVPWALRGGSALIALLSLVWIVERSVVPVIADSAAPKPAGRLAPAAVEALPPALARLRERWQPAPPNGYSPLFRAHVSERLLAPALLDAWSALREPHLEHAAVLTELPSADAARVALENADPAPAAAWFSSAAAAFSRSEQPIAAGRAHVRRASVLTLGEPALAHTALEQALALDAEQAHAPLLLALLQARTGRLGHAEAGLRRLLDDGFGSDGFGTGLEGEDAPERLPSVRPAPGSDAERETRRAADAWSLLGDILSSRKRWAEAERALQASLAAHARLDDPVALADDHRRLADVILALARPQEALVQYERAIDVGRTLADADVLAADHRNAAAVAQLLGDLLVAARLYRRAVEIDEAQDDRARLRDDLGRLCSVYRELKQFAEARSCLERTLSLDVASGSHDNQLEDLVQLGNLHQLHGQLDLAEEYYSRALALPAPSERSRADLYANLGNIHRRRGNTDRAIALYRMALLDYQGAGQASKAARVEQYLARFAADTPGAVMVPSRAASSR
jgi:tetratricopeptide (TPR) repeat protein